MSNRKHIPKHGTLPEDKLLAYLEGRLTADEQREVEAILHEDGMESDAVEGLNELSARDTRQVASRINYKLQHDLKTKRYRNNKLFVDNKWAWLAVLIVLSLCILAYCVIKML